MRKRDWKRMCKQLSRELEDESSLLFAALEAEAEAYKERGDTLSDLAAANERVKAIEQSYEQMRVDLEMVTKERDIYRSDLGTQIRVNGELEQERDLARAELEVEKAAFGLVFDQWARDVIPPYYDMEDWRDKARAQLAAEVAPGTQEGMKPEAARLCD